MKTERRPFRMIGWMETDAGKLLPCEDVGRYRTLEDVEASARAILDDGNAEYIELYEGDRKVKTLYRAQLQ